MLNAKALTSLFSQNTDNRLCKRWYLMTPNGTLLAHSHPTDINDLRKQAAIAALTWQEHQDQDPTNYLNETFHGEIREDADQQQPLHVLTIESDTTNVLMRQIQRQLLLVLEGAVPPRRSSFERRVTAESIDGTQQQWPHGSHESADGTSVRSNATGTNGGASGVLKLQRAKLDALANAIIADFESTGFSMPEDGPGGTTIF